MKLMRLMKIQFQQRLKKKQSRLTSSAYAEYCMSWAFYIFIRRKV